MKNKHKATTYILNVFVVEFVIDSFFDGLLFFRDFIQGRNLHSCTVHLKHAHVDSSGLSNYTSHCTSHNHWVYPDFSVRLIGSLYL